MDNSGALDEGEFLDAVPLTDDIFTMLDHNRDSLVESWELLMALQTLNSRDESSDGASMR